MIVVLIKKNSYSDTMAGRYRVKFFISVVMEYKRNILCKFHKKIIIFLDIANKLTLTYGVISLSH